MVKITGIHATYFIVRISHKYAIEKPNTKKQQPLHSGVAAEKIYENTSNSQFSKKVVLKQKQLTRR